MEYNTHTLRNGLRIIHQPTSSNVAYCGFAINVGTRDELPHEQGMAHFVEHLLFKGTTSRKARSIINRMEAVGGELNAYTNKEETVVYSTFLVEHFGRAVDLLGDIVFHSTFPLPEIRKEAKVVLDEIRSYEDSPSELIFDDFEDMIFRDHPLGHNILGTPKLLKKYTTEDVQRFTSRYYHPSNAVFFVQGDLSFKEICLLVQKAIGRVPNVQIENKRLPPPDVVPETLTIRKRSRQAHVMLGCTAYNIYDEKRTALYLLSNMLGGPGMNSKLNVSMREREGLVYNVESNLISYTDTGLFSIYFGANPKHIDECLQLVERQLWLFHTQTLSHTQLAAAKKQLIGQIAVAADNNENNALGMAKAFLHNNLYELPELLSRRINELTAGQVRQVSREILNPNRMSTLIYK